jgi:hypothetical protein
MTLQWKGKQGYGDSQADIRTYLSEFSKANKYLCEHYADAACKCGSSVFKLDLDDDEGAAVRCCPKCGLEHPIGDSANYLDVASLEARECLCGNGIFEITIGVALYRDSDDVKWIYVGCRCVSCCLVGCYGHWKNEFEDYRKLLAMI